MYFVKNGAISVGSSGAGGTGTGGEGGGISSVGSGLELDSDGKLTISEDVLTRRDIADDVDTDGWAEQLDEELV